MNTESMSYIGIKPGCGCVVAAVVDTPEHADDIGKDVQEFIRSGLRIERVTTEYVRQNLRHCRHQSPAQLGLI